MSNKPTYLSKLPDWTVEQAETNAAELNINLTDEHIQVLLVAREFFNEFGFSPSMRPLCKSVSSNLGVDKGRSLYLNEKFPGSPAKSVALLAGLPKPKNCL
ncbi:MAG: TusE/DsrC/DsvC family sulfur relay protein [Porticoccaceae bacterium]